MLKPSGRTAAKLWMAKPRNLKKGAYSGGERTKLEEKLKITATTLVFCTSSARVQLFRNGANRQTSK